MVDSNSNNRNDILKSGVLICAIIAAVAGLLLGAMSDLGGRFSRGETRNIATLKVLDDKLQIEVHDLDDKLEIEIRDLDAKLQIEINDLQLRYLNHQVEIFRLRDRVDLIPTLEAEVAVLKAEIERLRKQFHES